METKATLCAAVHEVLDKDNYVDWSVRVQTYLMAQDLWNTVEPITEPPKQGTNRALRKKNSMALHVIQISCGSDAFSMIREINSAKDAWNTLKGKYSPKNIVSGMDNNESNDYGEYVDLCKALRSGELNYARDFFVLRPNAVNAKITILGQTALHIAVVAKHLHIVEELVELMWEEALEIEDDKGNTALFEALFIGNWRMAKCMLDKNKRLVSIGNKSKILPVVMAIQFQDTKLARYLSDLTSIEDLVSEKGVNGATLCTQAIYTNNLDIALDLIQRYPHLALALDKDNCSPLYALSAMPYAFLSGDRPVFWKRWIYSLLALLCQLGSNLRIHEHLYEMELIHTSYHKLLLHMCEEISRSNMQQRQKGCVDEAIFCAIKNGNFEFLFHIVKANSDLLQSSDRESRNIFLLAVLHRQPKIFSLIYGLEEKNAMIYDSDVYGNFILHMAGMSAASTLHNRSSVPALQMQRELQWFKEVESIVHPKVKEALNKDGLTPRELFTKNHKDMMQAGEQWMKGTATSCTTIAALIVTITFATAFTIPGGNDQYTGFPVFLQKKLFMVYIIFDALSLFSSSTSVLVFLKILSSRYAEEDFLKSLPITMAIGLSTLFFSIATMMITFSAGLLLMLHGRSWLVKAVIYLAGVPIALFILMLFGLLVDLFNSTFKPGIFDRKMKSWV